MTLEASQYRQWVIVYGSLFEGVVGVVGPFSDRAAATAYGDTHHLGNGEWMVVELMDA